MPDLSDIFSFLSPKGGLDAHEKVAEVRNFIRAKNKELMLLARREQSNVLKKRLRKAAMLLYRAEKATDKRPYIRAIQLLYAAERYLNEAHQDGFAFTGQDIVQRIRTLAEADALMLEHDFDEILDDKKTINEASETGKDLRDTYMGIVEHVPEGLLDANHLKQVIDERYNEFRSLIVDKGKEEVEQLLRKGDVPKARNVVRSLETYVSSNDLKHRSAQVATLHWLTYLTEAEKLIMQGRKSQDPQECVMLLQSAHSILNRLRVHINVEHAMQELRQAQDELGRRNQQALRTRPEFPM